MATWTNEAITSFSFVPAPISPLPAYGSTTDTIVDMRGMKEQGLLVKNTGAGSLTYQINGSYDDGLTFDMPIQADTAVAPSAQNQFLGTSYYTHWQIRVKSAATTTAQLKIVALGV